MDEESVRTDSEAVLVEALEQIGGSSNERDLFETDEERAQEEEPVQEEPEQEEPEQEEPAQEEEPVQEEQEEEEEEESYEYTDNQVKEIRKAFKVFDTVRNDAIPIVYLGSVLRALGQNPTDGQLKDHAKWLHADPKGGMVRFKEFLIIMGRTLKDPITTERVLKGFRCLDDDNVGVVLCDQLRAVLTNTGERLYPREFAVFLKYADPKRKGIVKYEKFVAKMNRKAEGGGGKKAKKKKKKGKKKRKTKKIKHREGEEYSSQ